MSVLLRPMGLHDIDAVSVLEQDLFGVEAWSPELLAGEMTADPVSRYYLVAEDKGVVTGYGGLMAQSGGQADVLTLAVTADRWGEGIGSALLDGLLAEADRRGCTEIFLEVRVDNDRAQRLYRRRGRLVRKAWESHDGTTPERAGRGGEGGLGSTLLGAPGTRASGRRRYNGSAGGSWSPRASRSAQKTTAVAADG